MKTIVCYGDSNTYGYNPENGFRYEYEERWTTILQKELKDSAIVIPEGLNGRTTSFEDELRPGRNGATYLDPCLHSHGPIDLVVLMLGTNDLKIRFQATPTDIGKGIDRLPYLQESGVLANLLQDLELAENKALLSLLHLDEWLMKLKEACTEFDSLFLNRESDNSTKLSGQVKTARRGIQELFQNLANLIQAYEIVYGADAYTALSAKINEAVDYARTQAARRSSKGKGEEKTVTE